MPSLVSATCPSLQILGNTQTGYFQFPDSGQSVLKENYHNSRNSDDIDMKPGPVTKLDKRNKTKSKKYHKIVTSLSFFGFLANLEQSGGRISETESAKVILSVIRTFCLTETENRTKKSLTQL